MLALHGNLRQNVNVIEFAETAKIRFSAPLTIFRGAHRFEICIRLFIYCAGNKQKSSKIMTMKMFATLDKVKPDTENISGWGRSCV
jgi:hypothetical protein